MIIIFVVVVVAFTSIELLSSVIVDEMMRVTFSILISGACILGYKIPGIGCVFKFLTSLLSSYRVLLPGITWVASNFFSDEKLLIVEIVGVLVGAIVVTKWQIDVTEYTFLDTKPIDFDYIKYVLDIPRFSIPKFKYKFSKTKSDMFVDNIATVQQRNAEEEKLKIQFQKLEEEKRFIDEMRAQVEYEKRAMYEEYKNRRIGFFDGCSNVEDIKGRHRKLVQEYHPDGQRGNAEMFKKIQAEYEDLIKEM